MQIFSFAKIDKRKFLGTILGTIFFICCILFFTYAYYVWRSDDTNVIFSIQDINNSLNECITGPDVIVTNLGPVINLSDGVKVDFSLINSSEEILDTNISLNITSISNELKVDSFKYAVVVDTTNNQDYNYNNPILEGNFNLDNKTENIWNTENNILTIGIVSVEADSTYNYQFIVYIDGNVYNNPNMQNKELIGRLELGECKKTVANNQNINLPNLDNGNLIPVYYDDTIGVETWKKADSTNKNNSWYDYGNKMWANAVIISNSATTNYKNEPVGTPINDNDIQAFYVWIPRYKYRVWNITRQGGTENTYAYSAYSNGIDIVFENGTASTGNVKCRYVDTTITSATILSDECTYNETDIITTNSNNSNYQDAWYTHPAFTFGTGDGNEKTGFWIGKFETSGDGNNPKVIPDNISLTSQNISTQFTTSLKFQDYLSNSLEAHMLTNLEWGAVAYLTHSDYGLCDTNGCRDVYINNSEEYYTGRSGGDVAGSDELILNGYEKFNSYGNYNYKGYQLNSNGTPTSTKDITKVASTTGNITGVYDMSGGAYEYTMGNMVDNSGGFSVSSAGNSWGTSNQLDGKYYNSYSYYRDSTTNTSSFNRARLGDATSEILTCIGYECSWSKDDGGAYSVFVNGYSSWFSRGGGYDEDFAGSFYFYGYDGGGGRYDTFRSVLI